MEKKYTSEEFDTYEYRFDIRVVKDGYLENRDYPIRIYTDEIDKAWLTNIKP